MSFQMEDEERQTPISVISTKNLSKGRQTTTVNTATRGGNRQSIESFDEILSVELISEDT